jgi:D-alanine-D-alanine ligase-like ATP-grasp enzyme
MEDVKDKTLEHLLDLNGVRYVVDDTLGLWVKFETRKIKKMFNKSSNIYDTH